MAQLNDAIINGKIEVNGVEQPLITIGAASQGFPTNPKANQIHIMYDDTASASEE